MSSLYAKERLPHHLFYELIIPYLFSQYLHQLIVYDRAQEWNPFTHLPLVSKKLHRACQLLVQRIFDLHPAARRDHNQIILDLLEPTRKLWQEARKLPLYRQPRRLALTPEYSNQMASKSLIQIYICAGYAKYFYTVDVLNWICLDRLWISSGDPTTVSQGLRSRQFEMVKENMHRLFLPFNCAIELCDLIQEDVLAGPIADYLAKKAVTYCTEPVLLDYSQDLEWFMAKRVDKSFVFRDTIWNESITKGLELIDNLLRELELLRHVQKSGELVSKYRRPLQITKTSIINTRILDALGAIALADWGEDTEEIREYAGNIIDDLQDILDSTKAGEPEEHDEYFEEGGRRIYYLRSD